MRSKFYLGSLIRQLATAAALLPVLASGQAPATFGAPCPAANGTVEDRTYPIRKQAFDAITAGNSADARQLMRCAIRANPHDAIALKQEVYLDLSAKDEKGAAEDIDALRQLGESSPQFEAQEGYIFANEKRYDDARLAFGRAIAGTYPDGDAKLRAQAMKAIHVLDDEFPRHVIEVSADAQYLNRFSDGVVDATARYYERIGVSSPFRVYVGERLLRDTASNGGTLPQIFSDNALLSGVGIAFQAHDSPLFLSAEANAAYLFYGSKNGTAAVVPDTRAVAGYYKIWRSGRDSTIGDRFSFEANGSFGFYSRYKHDGIAYLQPREIVDLTHEGSLRLRPFLQQSVALDTNQQFYNNVFELIPGLEVSNINLHGVSLRAEYVRGFYLPFANSSANPYGSSYSDFRFRLLFQKSHSFGSGAR
jgi:tetratricopeptide (TPR) repeat protein